MLNLALRSAVSTAPNWLRGGQRSMAFPALRRPTRIAQLRRCLGYSIGLSSALFGLAIFPAFYVATGIPETADYPASVLAVALGTIIFASGLWVFRISHKVLGRNWSITLQIREQHRLVCVGPYAVVRHPMYTSFLLIGIGQALLLSNWLIALAGLVGFAILFFSG